MLRGEEELEAGTVDYEYEQEREFQTSTPINNRFSRSKSNGNYYQSTHNNHHQDQYSLQQSSQQRGGGYQSQYRGAVKTPLSSTTSLDSRDRLIEELQKSLSQVAFENEELKHELNQARRDVEELANENQRLSEENQQKDIIRQKMGAKLAYVTQAAVTLCEKLSALKCRYYGENHAWLTNGSAAKK